MSSELRRWHVLQTGPNRCVAACLAMVARRCTVAFTEEDGDPFSAKGWDLHFDFLDTQATPNGKRLVLDLDYAGLAQLRVALAQPAWVVVEVSGPLWVMTVTGDRAHPGFGALCPKGDAGPPFHSVVVAQAAADGASTPSWP